MIWFDNLRSYGTPNYYVQKLFSVNKGTRRLAVSVDGSPKNGQGEIYTSAALDEGTGEVIVKIVNTSSSSKEARINLAGALKTGRTGTASVLQSDELKGENSLDHPTKIAPVERPLQVSAPEFSYTLEPRSFTVLRVPTR
jgi:alpha-N-arabinofuranosidase